MSTENTGPVCAACGGPCTGACWKKKAAVGFFALAVSGSLLLLAMFVGEMKSLPFIGRDVPGEFATISVSGEGEAFRVPDIAEISFSIVAEAKDAAGARKLVDEKMKAIHEFLTTSGVEEKDIKNTGYNLNPKYEWKQTSAYTPCLSGYCPPVEGKQVLVGYEVNQSVDVRVRKVDDAGLIVGGLADKGASYMNGPTFKVDDEDGVKAEARDKAIKQAKEKAEKLAAELGVELVRITAFNEDGSYPIYNYAREKSAMMAMDGMGGGAPAPANISAGENRFTSNVNIVYEIR